MRLREEGVPLLGIDRLPNRWEPDLPTLLGDLSAPAAAALLDQAVGELQPTVLVHLAARAKVHESVGRPQNALENIQATFAVLEAARRWRLPFLAASSREVYGEQAQFPVPEDAVRHADAASPYAAGKMADEALCRAYARCYGLRALVIRFSNVYGRYEDYERTERFLPLLFRRVPRGEPVTIYGPEKAYDFTYMDDAVEGVVRAVRALHAGQDLPPAINLGTGHGTSLTEVARLVGEACGVPPRLSYAPMRVGEISRYVADLRRAEQYLGYRPRYLPAQGIPLAWEWWRRHVLAPARPAAAAAAQP